MNIRFRKQEQERGSILVVTIFIGTAIAVALGSYLLLVRTQNVSVVRSQAWSAALAMAEAGAEEALAQLNPGAIATTISVNRSANGWGAPSGGVYGPVSRSLTNASYSVVFTDATFPIIYSTGYVTLPDLSATLARVVRIATTNVPLYNVGLAARSGISMNGNGVSVDSFDSSNPALSTNGRYDPAKTSTNGTVALVSGSLSVGNHSISGNLMLGPTATYAGSPNSVSGTISSDLNVDFPQVALPPDVGSWSTLALPLPGIVNGVLYNYVFNAPGGDYIIPSLSGNVYIASNATVRLDVQSGGSSGVQVAGTGSKAGKLTVYIASPSFSVGGNGAVDGGNPANLSYYGLPSNTSISFSGNALFTGTLYAPSADLTLNGGGNNTYDFVGSCVAKSVTMNGHFMFHFDQNLLNAGASRGYLATYWQEL